MVIQMCNIELDTHLTGPPCLRVCLTDPQEAVVDDSDPKYPVIIFSHGLGGCRSTYSILCAELASQVKHCLDPGHALLLL